ncbi:MAG: hypothetical protein V4667_07740 [Bacteroidota bacterium]
MTARVLNLQVLRFKLFVMFLFTYTDFLIKQIVISLLLFCSTEHLFCQEIIVLKSYSDRNIQRQNGFYYLNDSLISKKIIPIAQLKITDVDVKTNIEKLTKTIAVKSNSIGANSFKILEYNDSLNFFLIEVCFLTEELVAENKMLQEKNMIYVFGNVKRLNKNWNFKHNKLKISIKSGQYYKIDNNKEHSTRLNKGGFTGSTVWLESSPNKPSSYFTMSGFGLVDIYSTNSPYYHSATGIMFTTGKLRYLDESASRLLMKMLYEMK